MLLKKQITKFGSFLSKEEWKQKLREFNIPKCPHAKDEQWLCGECAQEVFNKNQELQDALEQEMEFNDNLKREIEYKIEKFEIENLKVKKELAILIGISNKMRADMYEIVHYFKHLSDSIQNVVYDISNDSILSQSIDGNLNYELENLRKTAGEIGRLFVSVLGGSFYKYEYNNSHPLDFESQRESEMSSLANMGMDFEEREFWRKRNEMAILLSPPKKDLTNDDLPF